MQLGESREVDAGVGERNVQQTVAVVVGQSENGAEVAPY